MANYKQKETCINSKLNKACEVAKEISDEATEIFGNWLVEKDFNNGPQDKRKVSKRRNKTKAIDGSVKRS